MAEFYLDVSAIGNEYQAYADTPTTWGVPQDGNGKAGPGHTAAVAIATIDCNGASAAGTGTVGVLGVTVSSTLNDSGAALATAIVSAINASATAVSATYSAALLPLNKLVFARVNPVLSTEVQIMLRIAGTDWNGMTPTRANITGGGVTAFTGGANGPFAYLCSTDTIFGKTARGYGLFTPLKVSAVLDPGALTDLIHCRTRRSGANLTVLMTDGTAYYNWSFTPTGAARQLLFDDGTLWSGDAGVLTLNVYAPSGYIGGGVLMGPGSSAFSIASRSGKRFRLYSDIRGNSSGHTLTGSQMTLEGIVIEESPQMVTSLGMAGFTNSNERVYVRNSTWIAKGARQLAATSNNPNGRIIYDQVDFEYFGLSANISNIVNLNAGGANGQVIRFTACSFKDRNGVYSVVSPVLGNAGAPALVEFDNCTGVDGVASGWPGAIADSNRQLLWENFGPSRDWRVESGVWLAEWRVGQNFPTLTSLLPNGQPWSAKVLLRNSGIWGVPHKVLKLPGYYRDTTAARTITLELLTSQALSRSQLGLMFAYIDNNDVVRYQSTLLSYGQQLLAPVNFGTSAKSWTLNGLTGQSAFKLELATEYPIKQGTEFVAWLVYTGALTSDQTVYVNGEVDIT